MKDAYIDTKRPQKYLCVKVVSSNRPKFYREVVFVILNKRWNFDNMYIVELY